MKFIILAICIVAVFCGLSEYEADAVRMSGATFEVGIHPQFEGKSDYELSRMVMRTLPGPMLTSEGEIVTPVEDEHLIVGAPATFDARDKWGAKCPTVKEIRNQAQCGSCWAFGAAEVASDRHCIATGRSVKLSPQWLVSCDHLNHGCNGGALWVAWEHIRIFGISTDVCMPYTSQAGHVAKCPKHCTDGSKPHKIHAHSVKTMKHETAMMNELYEHGPIEASFHVYRDFYYYAGGVYEHKTGGKMGAHAIKVIGWGEENGVKYWNVANSWGETWGIHGTFKIRRGVDECGIETASIVAGHFKA